MTYNIHPIFVHFPIALLVLYSIIKLLPLARWFPKVSWKDIERVLLLVGVLGAFSALATGESAEHLVRPDRQLTKAHSLFATMATWLYVALLLGEALTLGKELLVKFISNYRILSVINFFQKNLTHPLYSGVIALIGLIAISLAGLLGGVITYGVGADPFAATALQLLGITL